MPDGTLKFVLPAEVLPCISYNTAKKPNPLKRELCSWFEPCLHLVLHGLSTCSGSFFNMIDIILRFRFNLSGKMCSDNLAFWQLPPVLRDIGVKMLTFYEISCTWLSCLV